MKRLTTGLLALLLSLSLLAGCGSSRPSPPPPDQSAQSTGQADASLGSTSAGQDSPASSGQPRTEVLPPDGADAFRLADIPAYSGRAHVPVNDNIPYFEPDQLPGNSVAFYGQRDHLGRCTAAFACVGQDIMPTQDRGSIGQVKPTGWHTVKYDCVDGKYLYNRCHLIGYQLTGENANEDNLITGTRYLNIEGMLPFENLVADYVEEMGNHVAYRVTPIFEGDNLLASGVLMEGYSLEDEGDGVCYCVYAYNVQPCVEIDYATGDSRLSSEQAVQQLDPSSSNADSQVRYVLNTSSKKFHLPGCSSVEQMNQENRLDYTGSRQKFLDQGYSPCGRCSP